MSEINPMSSSFQASKIRPLDNFPNDNNLTEIAIRRHEDRIQRSTAAEIEELDRYKSTGVMSLEAADALKFYALASMQIDLGQVSPKARPSYEAKN